MISLPVCSWKGSKEAREGGRKGGKEGGKGGGIRMQHLCIVLHLVNGGFRETNFLFVSENETEAL